MCVRACSQYDITVTQPVKMEMMMTTMCKGIRYQTMIHFKSLLDTISFDREQRKTLQLPPDEHRQSDDGRAGGSGGKNKNLTVDTADREVLKMV